MSDYELTIKIKSDRVLFFDENDDCIGSLDDFGEFWNQDGFTHKEPELPYDEFVAYTVPKKLLVFLLDNIELLYGKVLSKTEEGKLVEYEVEYPDFHKMKVRSK